MFSGIHKSLESPITRFYLITTPTYLKILRPTFWRLLGVTQGVSVFAST